MLPFQPNIARFLAAIRHEEPDCVPLAEFGVDEPVMDQFTGKRML